MERLEAALEKARQDRETVQAKPVEKNGNTSKTLKTADLWASMRDVKISGRVARNNRISTVKQGKQSGSYDLLRSRALRIMDENGWTSLAITSPNKTCGKTTVCANLAFSLSRQSDLRVIVLDMDLRRPSMHKILGQRPTNSLHQVLQDKHPIEDAFIRVAPNLAFALNNTPATNPSELLQSKLTKSRLNEIREKYQPDLVIFDMPPMLVSDDNVGFLPSVDCALLIGAADSTTIAQLDVCEKELSVLTNVLGVVLNKCRYTDADAGYTNDYY